MNLRPLDPQSGAQRPRVSVLVRRCRALSQVADGDSSGIVRRCPSPGQGVHIVPLLHLLLHGSPPGPPVAAGDLEPGRSRQAPSAHGSFQRRRGSPITSVALTRRTHTQRGSLMITTTVHQDQPMPSPSIRSASITSTRPAWSVKVQVGIESALRVVPGSTLAASMARTGPVWCGMPVCTWRGAFPLGDPGLFDKLRSPGGTGTFVHSQPVPPDKISHLLQHWG